MEAQNKRIERYLKADGKSPFTEWLEALKDRKARAIVKGRLGRIEEGNFGDCEPIGAGVFELKIDYGPGYRVYYGQVDLTIVLLLCGGDKSTQKQDIKRAKAYWADYKDEQEEE